MQPKPCLRLRRAFWTKLTLELHRRTEGCHESGAFLLGHKGEGGREAVTAVYYDELDAHAYSTGVCVLHAGAFGRLWDRCATASLTVVADAHVHLLGARQSLADRENPMIAQPGHLALILPRMARPPIRRWSVGLFEYLGDHQWGTHGGCRIAHMLKIEGDQ